MNLSPIAFEINNEIRHIRAVLSGTKTHQRCCDN